MTSVGSKLKKAREKKQLSLKDVSQKTKIHLKILEALEEDRAESHLSRVYIKSFLKSYANLVALNGEQLLQEYLGDSSRESSPFVPNAVETSFWEKDKEIASWVRRSLIVILIIGALSLGGIGISRIRRDISFPSSRPHRKFSLKKGSLTAYPFRIPKNEPLTVTLRANENTWITVLSDGRLMYQGLLTKGEEESWVAKRRLQLSLSDGGAIRLGLNRHALGIPGEAGRPLEKLLLTPEGWGLGVKE